MECGKLTAKLRDAVPVCFMVNDHEVKRYKNIEIPEEIKHLEYCGFQFCVPEDGGAITFKIWFNEGILPEIWPATRERQHRAAKQEQRPTMELQYGVTGADRKTLVAAMSTIMRVDPRYLGMPSQAYQIGEYEVSKDGTLTGPESKAIIEALAAKGFTEVEQRKRPKRNKPGFRKWRPGISVFFLTPVIKQALAAKFRQHFQHVLANLFWVVVQSRADYAQPVRSQAPAMKAGIPVLLIFFILLVGNLLHDSSLQASKRSVFFEITVIATEISHNSCL